MADRKKSSRPKPKAKGAKSASRAKPAARPKAASGKKIARPKAARARTAAGVRPAAKAAEGVVYSDLRRDAVMRRLLGSS
ncbi:MAG TPA: hypothetical protein VFG80_11650 [Myxococcota bacterium]|nr:hypothetical protein [Myxococcota bacterium]